MKNVEVYIAVSIHGTNCFITAAKKHSMNRSTVFVEGRQLRIRNKRFSIARITELDDKVTVKLYTSTLGVKGTSCTSGVTERAINSPSTILNFLTLLRKMVGRSGVVMSSKSTTCSDLTEFEFRALGFFINAQQLTRGEFFYKMGYSLGRREPYNSPSYVASGQISRLVRSGLICCVPQSRPPSFAITYLGVMRYMNHLG